MNGDEKCLYFQGVTYTPKIIFPQFSSSYIPSAEPLGYLNYLMYLRLRNQLEPLRNHRFHGQR